MNAKEISQPAASPVLAEAVGRAAESLGLSAGELAAVLGASVSSVPRTSNRRRSIDPAAKEGELALLFLKVFRNLDVLLGGDAEKCRRWLRAYNEHLAGVPAELIQTAHGLVRAANYLDALHGQG